VFNVVGPLCNPGQPPAALLGCADVRLAPVLAAVQQSRGFSAAVVRTDLGLDEISTAGSTQVWDVTTHEVRHEVLEGSHLGVTEADVDDLRGGDAAHNAQVVRDVLSGSRDGGTQKVRDVVAVNAAAALVVFDATRDSHQFGSPQESFVSRVRAALPVAFASIDDGSAASVLEAMARVSTALAGE
jgi:anthranilate phosphoribosyltransferase